MDDTSLTDFLDEDGASEDSSPDDGGEERTDAGQKDGNASGECLPDDSSSNDGQRGDSPSSDGQRNDSAPDADQSNDVAPVNPGDVEPATSTAAWSPGSATCDACGARTDWRYRDDAGLVCPDCTSWS